MIERLDGHPNPNMETGRILVRGRELEYRLINPQSPGLPLFVAHGGPGSSMNDWKDIEELGDERPVFLYNQLGSGDKRRRPKNLDVFDLDYFVEEFDTVFHFVRSRFEGRDVHILGHSWGGLLANEWMLRGKREGKQREGVRSITFASPMLSIQLLKADTQKLLKRMKIPGIEGDIYERLVQLEKEEKTESEEYQTIFREIDERLLYGMRYWELPKHLKKALKQFNMELFVRMVGRSPVTATGLLGTHDRLDDLEEYEKMRLGGVLLTGGVEDLMSPETIYKYAEKIPGSEVVIFAGSSHYPHVKEKRLYRAVLRDFLRRSEAA